MPTQFAAFAPAHGRPSRKLPSRGRMCAAAAALLVAAGAAQGQEAPPIRVELNKLEPADGACRAYLVVENSGQALEALGLDLVMFDLGGVISKRLAVEVGPLRAGRTSVKAFVVDGVACESIERVLLNDVLACGGEGGADSGCLSRIELSSRASADFID